MCMAIYCRIMDTVVLNVLFIHENIDYIHENIHFAVIN